jgi:uncharacterized membrane protein
VNYDRGFRSLLMTGALVVLLGLVAFSSRSGFSSSNAPAVSNTYISYAMSVFLIVFVLMIPVAIYSYFVRTKEMGAIGSRSPGKQLRRMIYALVFIGIALYVRRYVHGHGGLFGHNGLFHISKDPTNGAKLKGADGKTQQPPHFEWIVLWIFLAVASVFSVASFIAYKRRPPQPVKEPMTLAEEFAAGIDDAIDDLERETDPRKAVIAAYARMERTFERQGLARRPSETAIEYLRRVLHEITSRSGAVERLTSLFEGAKFSKHEVTVDMKTDAIASLREIRESIA